jgi:hypothetical protein
MPSSKMNNINIKLIHKLYRNETNQIDIIYQSLDIYHKILKENRHGSRAIIILKTKN